MPTLTRTTIVALLALLLAAVCTSRSLAADEPVGVFTTIAGTGNASNNGHAGPALKTHIGNPFGVEVGPDGALYICEVANHRVRRLDLKTGGLTTVAGNGTKGYSGDGGPAAAAQLNEPYEVRFDAAGNMYFVEMQNHVVRRVDAKTGVIATVAGTGKPGLAPPVGKDGNALLAQFKQPHSIALDTRPGKNHLYIADIANHRICRVELATGVVTTIAGTGERKLPVAGQTIAGKPIVGPRALCVDGANLWIALREGHSVWRLDLDTGVIHHVAGTGQKGFKDGPGDEATFNGPKGIAVFRAPPGAAAFVYVADTENQAIRRIDAATRTVTTIAGAGPQGRGFNGDELPATQAHMARPHGVCVGPDGAVYIGDSENHRVRRVK